MIYVAAEQVPNAMYRAWAEIMKDGKRVERSGLVGPRFEGADAAEQYALEWARQWIDRECLTQAAVDGLLRNAGINPDELLQPPAALDETCHAYCPRCETQFTALDGVCADCGGVALLPVGPLVDATGGVHIGPG